MYRLFYFENDLMKFIITDEPLEEISKKYNIFFLTDMYENVIIDNRKRGKENGL